jgi:hypothetical protein
VSPLAPTVWTAAAVAAFVATLGVIGADALWLVPLGGRVAHGHVPNSIPYATAPSSDWHDVPAIGQLTFWAAYHAFGGERGLVVLQAVAAAVGVGALARGIGRQSSAGVAFVMSLLVVLGALAAVAVTNVALFSLAFFPVLLGLVEAESLAPTRRIWLAVPLVAVWGNLHGAVLVGWALLACYLVLERVRLRPVQSSAVLAAATLAVFLNPALWNTPDYYRSVFENEAAKRGVGLWDPITTSALDVIAVAILAVFVGLAVRHGRKSFRLWEAVAIVGLGAATIHIARNAIWLLAVAAYPAARSVSFAGPRPRLLAVAAAAITFGVVAGLATTPRDPGSRRLARVAAGTGKTVLAEPVLGQQVALSGGRVWVDNPLDAFGRDDQKLYVDWFTGASRGSEAIDHAGVVLVRTRSAAGRMAAKDPRLVLLTARDGASLYRFRGAGGG